MSSNKVTKAFETIEKSCESTPFLFATIGEKNYIKIYRTKRAGLYGHQVYGIGFFNKNFSFVKTSGCGYNKADHALELILEELKITIKGVSIYSASDDIKKYHIGGNHYYIPLEDITHDEQPNPAMAA